VPPLFSFAFSKEAFAGFSLYSNLVFLNSEMLFVKSVINSFGMKVGLFTNFVEIISAHISELKL